jgi:hypothetical protein
MKSRIASASPALKIRAQSGSGVIDSEPSSEAAEEVLALAKEVSKILANAKGASASRKVAGTEAVAAKLGVSRGQGQAPGRLESAGPKSGSRESGSTGWC